MKTLRRTLSKNNPPWLQIGTLCKCGGGTRLIGIEPHPNGGPVELLTYECSVCGEFQVSEIPQDTAFDPQAIAAMATAYENACRALRLTERSDATTQKLALRIIELARTGERDLVKLREAALRGMQPSALQ